MTPRQKELFERLSEALTAGYGQALKWAHADKMAEAITEIKIIEVEVRSVALQLSQTEIPLLGFSSKGGTIK